LKLVEPDAEAMLARLRTFGGGDPTPPSVVPSAVRVRVQGSGTGDADPVAVPGALERQGFVGAGTAPAPATTLSEIRYRPHAFGAARLLADYIQDARLVADDTLKTSAIIVVLGASFTGLTVPTTTTVKAGAATTPATTTLPPTTTRPPTTT